jgi:hypothetical protein
MGKVFAKGEIVNIYLAAPFFNPEQVALVTHYAHTDHVRWFKKRGSLEAVYRHIIRRLQRAGAGYPRSQVVAPLAPAQRRAGKGR